MSDSPEELQQQLLEAQEALAEAQARCKRHDTEHLAVTKELEDNRSALLFMLEDLESSRKQIEHSFREWMSALDVVDDPIFLHDREFRILRCNKAYQQLAGIPFKQIIGQPYYEIFPKAATPLPCCLRAMGKAAEEEEEEVTVGEAVYRSRAFFIRDEQRDYLYSVHILEDISESRRAAAALYESEERLRKISESAQDAIIMMGADRNISFWNAAAERIFGYPAEEALGQDLHALIVPASEQAQFTKAFPHFEASGEGSIIGKVIEVTGLRKGGEAFPAELSVSATQLHGQWHAIGIVRDITGRKQAEEKVSKEKEKFRMLFDAIADTVAIHDLKGRILQVNHSACEHLGYSQEELLQMTVADIDTPEFAASVAENIKVLQEQGRLVAETAHIHRDGTVIPVELSARMIDYEGQPAVLSVARDITERKRAETTLRERNTLIEALLENAPIGFAMNSMDDGRMTYVSRRFAEIYGVLLGTSERLTDFFEKVYRDPVIREQIRARVMADISSGDAARMHWEDVPLITASGETRFISASNIPLPEQNVMISTVWDVTDRYKAAADLHEKEQNYRTLADSAPALIWTS
ncbi:MAG: PAS domain S-box protein, partial [Sideroxydans sp.]